MRPSPKITDWAGTRSCCRRRRRGTRGRGDDADRSRRARERIPRQRGSRRRRRARRLSCSTVKGYGRWPNGSALPIRIGLLYDFPQMRRSLRDSRCGSASTRSRRRGRLDRDIEFVERQSRGLAVGLAKPTSTRAFDELDDEGVVAIVGPSISDNALIVAPLCDAARIPAINYSGGERTRSQWMFHYQVGSLEEEPPVLAARMVERGLAPRGGDLRPVAGRSPLRRVLRSGAGPARARGHGHREHLVARRRRDDRTRRACATAIPTCSSTSASVCRRARSRSLVTRSAGRCRCSRTRR